jgi:SAM-dependent methyltransferase/ribosomal protein S18 acetylase RimI-like enzyme
MEDLSITGHLGRGTMQEVSTESTVRVRQCQTGDASVLARLHAENLSGRFDIPLMEAYYRACVQSERNFCICAEVNGATVGFVGLISDRMQILKSLLRRYGFTVFASIFGRPFLLVAFFRHLWSWLKIPIRSREMHLPRWEYRPVIVSKEYRGRGVTQLLFAAAEEMLDERGVKRVLVQVVKTNVAALRAYEKAGFCPGAERSAVIFMVKNLTEQPPRRVRLARESDLVPLPGKLPATEMSGCPLCRTLDQKIISEHEGKSLKRCLNCGVSFVFPQPSPGAMEAHFEDSAALGEKELECDFIRNRKRVLLRVAKYIQSRKREGSILDVGCAAGLLLTEHFRKPKWQACGVELSRQMAEKAAANGITVHCGNIHSAKFARNSFDVVSVIDTFYYFPEPQSELAEFHRVLKPDGILVLEFPLASSRIWRTSTRLGRLLSGASVPLLQSSDHALYYSPKSIALLLAGCGFRVEAVLPLPANEQSRMFRNLIYRIYGLLSQTLYYVSFSRIVLTPRFLVVARKRP